MERDSINWAKGRDLSKLSHFPDCASKPGSRHTIVCHAANFALGYWSWSEKPWRGIPGPIQALLQMVLPVIEPATPTSQVGEITKSSPRRTHCKMWVCFFSCRCRKYYICPAPPHQPPNYPPKLGCHMLAFTGYAMTPSYFSELIYLDVISKQCEISQRFCAPHFLIDTPR